MRIITITITIALGLMVPTVAVASQIATGSTPPCTKQALAAGLRRGPRPLAGRVVRPWECAGRFAAAGVIAHGDEFTVVFRAHDVIWEPTASAKYCKDGQIPARIYQLACNSN
jgi:hypothetical protein